MLATVSFHLCVLLSVASTPDEFPTSQQGLARESNCEAQKYDDVVSLLQAPSGGSLSRHSASAKKHADAPHVDAAASFSQSSTEVKWPLHWGVVFIVVGIMVAAAIIFVVWEYALKNKQEPESPCHTPDGSPVASPAGTARQAEPKPPQTACPNDCKAAEPSCKAAEVASAIGAVSSTQATTKDTSEVPPKATTPPKAASMPDNFKQDTLPIPGQQAEDTLPVPQQQQGGRRRSAQFWDSFYSRG